MTTPDNWPRIKAIFCAALACPPDERATFLNSACPQDDQLRAEVSFLIDAYEQARTLSSPGWPLTRSGNTERPQTIGPYRFIRELGAGGMGEVWLAEQTEPVRRLVAMKLIRSGFYLPSSRARFLAERQSLASMNHPSIAKVFEAGATAAGQPYLVMEYVEGFPITEYCDRNQLPIADRLRLFQLVCEGVQHAHQKAVIHRDLKPSNILVTECDGTPTPRIIDFGVAKALSNDVDPDRTRTRVGAVVGTPGYMSPEQADPDSEDIDTRTDGYSLGVVLYELLVGLLPLDCRKLTLYETLRQLHERQPVRPSLRLRAADNALVIAHKRNTDPAALLRLLRGDLDSIVLKAIEKDRSQRYETPSALAADIARFGRSEPVTAHAPSVRYLVRKYVRRHRFGVGAAAVVAMLLIGFVLAQTWTLRNTRRQRDRADRITAFMTDMFKVSDPSESRGNAITARQILDQSAHQLETGAGLDPAVRQQLLQVMANTYLGLGIYNRAYDLAQSVWENRRQSLGPDNRNTLESMALVAKTLDRQGKLSEAQTLLEKAIDMETRALGPKDSVTLQSKEDLAAIFDGHAHYLEAEKLERAIIPVERRELGPLHTQTLRSLNTLAVALKRQSRFAEAGAILKQLLQDERRTLGPDHPYTLVTMHNLANMFAEQGHSREAEALYRETIAIERRVLGPEHPDTASSITTLANTVTLDPHRQREAEALYRQALEIELRAVGPDHTYTTQAKEGLANNLTDQHRYIEAQQSLQQVLATRQRTLGPDNTDTLLTGYNLATVLVRQKLFSKAEQLIRQTLVRQLKVLDANDLDIPASETLLARILLKEEQPREAEKLSRQAYTTQLRFLGLEHGDTQNSLFYLGKSLARLGRYDEARTVYKNAIDKLAAHADENVPYAWYNLACVSAFSGHPDDAFTYLGSAMQAGFKDVENLSTDDDLVSLHKDPRFSQVVAAVQSQARSPSLIQH